VLVDDLSRLARDNHLMLSIIAELHFEGIRVVSVADGLDSTDEESTLAIQVRGIFNELQLRDLKKKTLRGRMGQKGARVLCRREDVRLPLRACR
jgi:DNA invertase Pin-like site-specific DNA recombinase